MKKSTVHLHALVVLPCLLVILAPRADAAAANWTGGGGANTNWSIAANWINGSGGSGELVSGADAANFGATAAAGSPGTVNNFVDQDFTVTGLIFNQASSAAFHTTQIPSGQTLTVSGDFTVGGMTADNAVTSVSLTGAGTLLQNSGNLNVRNAGSTANSSLATNDLSGLNNFIYNVPAGTVNIGTGQRGQGTLILGAVSNQITAATINLVTGATTTGGPASLLGLGGGTNILNANTINIAIDKASALVQFQGAGGGLSIRSADGVGRANITVASRGQSGGALAPSLVNLNGHPVDIAVGTLIVGRSSNSSTGAGGLSFDNGTVDATSVEIGTASSGTANGTNNVGSGGTFIIGSGGMKLGNRTTSGSATAILNVNGGTVICSNNITTTTTSTTSRLLLSGGATLNMVNSGTLGVGTLAMTNSTLRLAPGAGGSLVNATVSTLAIGGAGNTINIVSNSAWVSAGVISTYPTTLHLIQITTLSGDTNVSPFTLGPLPLLNGVQLTGQIVTNAGYVDLRITGGPAVSITTNVWVGATNGVLVSNWDNTTLNWHQLSSSTPTAFADLNAVIFDDSASNATVTLTTTVNPASMTVSNAALGYTFGGAGKLTGSSGMLKQGPGTLTLSESGGDDFIGGITVAGGTLNLLNTGVNISGGLTVGNGTLNVGHDGAIAGGLSVGANGLAMLDQLTGTISGATTIDSSGTVRVGNNDAQGALPTGTVTDNGSLVVNRTDNLTIGNAISGAGTLTKLNNNTLILSVNNNSFTGGATINGGRVQVIGTSGNSGLGKGDTTVNTNGTLVAGGSDAFGFAPNHNNPATIFIHGGTVTDLGTSSFRVTLPNLSFTGGTLTNDSGNLGDGNGHYSFFGNVTCTITTLSNDTTVVISAGKISLQNPTTFDVAAGGVAGGLTPGVDLLISSVLANFNTTVRTVTKNGNGVLALDANNLFTGNVTINAGTVQLGTSGDSANLTSPLGGGSVVNNSTLNFASSQSVTVNNAISGPGAVVVSSGTGVLGGANTYTGNTIVNAGTLEIVLPTLATTATVLVTNGAMLKLDFAETNTVAGLVLNGTNQPPGVYNATTQPTYISGAGSLLVPLPVPPTPTITGINVLGATLTLSATNGAVGGQVVLLSSTNLALPLSSWTAVLTNNFDGNGMLNLSTNVIDPNAMQMFYILMQ